MIDEGRVISTNDPLALIKPIIIKRHKKLNIQEKSIGQYTQLGEPQIPVKIGIQTIWPSNPNRGNCIFDAVINPLAHIG